MTHSYRKYLDIIGDLLYDVSSYLMSPFFVLMVYPERHREIIDKGVAMRMLSQVFHEFSRIVETNRELAGSKFSIEIIGDNGSKRAPKEEIIDIVRQAISLHREGLRKMLRETPSEDIIDFIEKYYVEDSEEEPVYVDTIETLNEVDRPVPVKLYLYSEKAKEKKMRLKKPARVEEKRQTLPLSDVEKILKEYDPSKAEVLDDYGHVRITRYRGHVFAEYWYVWEVVGNKAIRRDIVVIESPLSSITPEAAIEEGLLNIVDKVGSVYRKYRVIPVNTPGKTGYIVVFLQKKNNEQPHTE